MTPIPPPAPARLGHVAGLDGLRGLAVVAVVGFHFWPHRVPAGFLGVSVFFTLSGFLITSVLLTSRDHGDLRLRSFWARRLRRLLPASLVTLVAIAAVWGAAGWYDRGLRGGLLASLFDVANWREVWIGERYGVSREASPVLHFWSLAIEEQIYLLLPVAVVVAATLRRVRFVLAGLLAVSVLATVLHAGDRVVVYYGTHTRAAELLLGALAAALLHGRLGARANLASGRRAAAGVVAAVAGAAVAALVLRTSLATAGYASGLLVLVGLLSTALVVGVTFSPPAGRVLDVAPLAWLGRVSYAVYLFHWPLLIGLTRAGMAPRLVPWVALVVTLVLAELSRRWLEEPIRYGSWRRMRPAAIGAPVMAAFALVLALWVPTAGAGDIDFEDALDEFDRRTQQTTSTTAAAPSDDPSGPTSESVPDTDPGAPRPVQLGMMGDSKALTLGLGMLTADDPRMRLGTSWAEFACPLGRGGSWRESAATLVRDLDESCDWEVEITRRIAEQPPVEVMVVLFGTGDVRERRVDHLGGWTTFPDPDYVAWLRDEAATLHDLLLGLDQPSNPGLARQVVWLTLPQDPTYGHPDRFAAYNDLVAGFAAHPSGCVDVVDLAGWMQAEGIPTERYMPDGRHTTFEPDGGTAREVGESFLIGELLAVAQGGCTP